jgi:hypothetical protein
VEGGGVIFDDRKGGGLNIQKLWGLVEVGTASKLLRLDIHGKIKREAIKAV